MNGHVSSFAELDAILARAHHLLLDFDGPICTLFAKTPTEPVSDRLREILILENVELPEHIQTTPDWFEILGYAHSVSPGLAARVAAELTEIETAAVATATPTAYVLDAVTACRESGRGVAVISNNSERVVRSYLDTHDLARLIPVVAARTEPDPARLKPSPYLIEQAAEALGTSPADCAVVGDSVTDMQAAHALGALAIGYPSAWADADDLTSAGAQAIVASMADLALRLRARPLPN